MTERFVAVRTFFALRMLASDSETRLASGRDRSRAVRGIPFNETGERNDSRSSETGLNAMKAEQKNARGRQKRDKKRVRIRHRTGGPDIDVGPSTERQRHDSEAGRRKGESHGQ